MLRAPAPAVDMLMEMGFPRVACEDALRQAKGDFSEATNVLLGESTGPVPAGGDSAGDPFDLCGTSSEEDEMQPVDPVGPPPEQPAKVKAEHAKNAKRSTAAVEDEDCQIDERRPAKAARPSGAISPLSSPAGDGAGDGDGDVMVTGAIDPTMGFAHARHNCRVPGMEFISASAPSSSASAKIVQNVRHCPQCFCFVCDGPAADCQDWGSHCMADESERWVAARQAKKQGGAPAAAAAAAAAFSACARLRCHRM